MFQDYALSSYALACALLKDNVTEAASTTSGELRSLRTRTPTGSVDLDGFDVEGKTVTFNEEPSPQYVAPSGGDDSVSDGSTGGAEARL